MRLIRFSAKKCWPGRRGSRIIGVVGTVASRKKLKKFIAYAPIIIDGDNNQSLTWSVAVVAPRTEVEGAIHEVYIRQFLLQGLVISLIMLAGGAAMFYESRWASSLEKEVQRKTEALKKSNEELIVSEKRYKSLVESAEDSILTVNAHNEILSVNRFGAQFLEYTVHGLVGKTIGRYFPRQSRRDPPRADRENLPGKNRFPDHPRRGDRQ